jgi:hypothetical protein
MKQSILLYARTNNALPASPNDLPAIPGKGNEVQDAWRNPFGWIAANDSH